MNSNGNSSKFCIKPIDGMGAFTGTLESTAVQKVHGLWDESSKRITFYVDTATVNEPAYFIGCYFPECQPEWIKAAGWDLGWVEKSERHGYAI